MFIFMNGILLDEIQTKLDNHIKIKEVSSLP